MADRLVAGPNSCARICSKFIFEIEYMGNKKIKIEIKNLPEIAPIAVSRSLTDDCRAHK